MHFPTRPFLAAVMVLTLLSSISVASTASAASVPECAAANITVTLGVMSRGVGGTASTTRVVPVYFKNRSVACHLPLTGPVVVAFREAKLSRTHTLTQVARPAAWSGQKYVVLPASSRNKALVEITALSNAAMKSAACGVQTATGLKIEGYAAPITSWIYFARKIADVCFYSGTGQGTTNVKMAWVGLK
ncbi:MAG TPA: hypothetical protein VGZ04_07390 [Acidimicrobiales bacterium]|jgi:hypothetical protein|nr:hypothetical protein [Acidimicrobiales bacterium]